MEKVTVKQMGIGTGAGEPVEILPRHEVEEIIENLDRYEVFHLAYSAWIPGAKAGECQLDLRNGELNTGSYSSGEMDQAIDSTYVILYGIDQNEDFDGLIDEDNDPYNIDDVWPGDWDYDIKWQLDEWYGQH